MGSAFAASLLCAGAPAEHAATSCPSVPRARASYFGADQPRIAAEALLPWSAFGLDGPPAARRLKIEVASSAWFHARWMSLSGLPPAEGSAHPERWAPVELGEIHSDLRLKGKRPAP